MKKFRILRGIKFLVFVAIAIVVSGFVVKSLWNWLMPVLFGLHAITFWQALGLFVLSKLLFGGFRRGGGGRGPWRRDVRMRWEGMSEEEREKFRAGMRGRWCSPRPVEPAS